MRRGQLTIFSIKDVNLDTSFPFDTQWHPICGTERAQLAHSYGSGPGLTVCLVSLGASSYSSTMESLDTNAISASCGIPWVSKVSGQFTLPNPMTIRPQSITMTFTLTWLRHLEVIYRWLMSGSGWDM